ncbi:MAG: hypothetical protein HY525_07865 [Betaproteobacteria bacterium]|nr:hypothetical protein [Betaproteobacteria bacterium]
MRKPQRRLIQLLAGIVACANLPAFDSWAQSYGSAGVGSSAHLANELFNSMAKAINTPEMKESLNKLGFEPHTSTPEQFAALIRAEIEQNARLIKAVGVKAE